MIDDYGVKVGDVVRFVHGKNKRNVAFTIMGKVILCKHHIPIGFARIKKLEVRDKYYLVTAEHIAYDLYPEISYSEFFDAIKVHSYEIGFDREFHDDNGNVQHQIFAYHPEYKTCIIAETYTLSKDDEYHFDRIQIYMPMANIKDFTRTSLFLSGGSNIVTLDAIRLKYNHHIRVLDYVSTYMNDIVILNHGLIKWPNDRPSFITHADYPNSTEEFCDIFYSRLALVSDDALKIFEGCDFMEEYRKRGN